MSFIRGKKGDAEQISWPEILFIVLFLAFVAVFFVFAKNAFTGSLIQEEVYAKKIALMIDSAKPNTTILLDITSLNKASVNSGNLKENYVKTISFNSAEKYVLVSARLGETGYKYYYFSDYNISGSYYVLGEKQFYKIEVGKNE